MDNENFKKAIAQAARSVGKRLKQVEFRQQSADHPILWGSEDSSYLKFYIFSVTEEK
jgi:23S rRNA (cytosine1962-C5)-methyltransferase